MREISQIKHIHKLFENAVENYENNTALCFKGKKLTFAQLNHYSNQLARHIIISTENEIVGIHMDRSFGLFIAILAILKSGKAYLPLNVHQPKDRKNIMLKDAGIDLIIQSSSLNRDEFITNDNMIKIISIDLDKSSIDEYDGCNLNLELPNDSLAYLMYTSGSTGRPKGVRVRHDGVVNRLLYSKKLYSYSELDISLQKTEFSFDVSVWEIFWPLIEGGTLYIANPDEHKNPDYLAHTIQVEKVSVVHFVPTMFSAFIARDPQEIYPNVKCVIFSGEELTKDHIHLALSVFPNALIYNMYGPTEASIEVTAFNCRNSLDTKLVPIGKAIDNVDIVVLDEFYRLVNSNTIGQLGIQGVALAEGYHNDVKKTSESFVYINGTRTYLTGDLGYIDDGLIYYTGRNDGQVKINGTRIELGEIINIILSKTRARDVKIKVLSGSDNVKRIVAFVLQYDGFDESEVKKILRNNLPELMVPSSIIPVTEFPITANGKTDYQMLIETYKVMNRKSNDFENNTLDKLLPTPRDTTEHKLAVIWEEILDCNYVGYKDDFFCLGGHSILLLKLITRIHNDFSVRLTPKQIFESSTIEELAKVISGNFATSRKQRLSLLYGDKENAKENIVLMPTIDNSLYAYTEMAKFLSEKFNVYSFEFIHGESLNMSIENQASLVIEELKKKGLSNHIQICGYCYGGILGGEVLRMLHEGGSFDNELIMIDSFPPTTDEASYRQLMREYMKRFEKVGYQRDELDYIAESYGADEMNQYVFNELKNVGLVSLSQTFEEVISNISLWISNHQVLSKYTPKYTDLQDRITLYEVYNSGVNAGNRWQTIGYNIKKVVTCKGNHYTIMRKPCVESITQDIINSIESMLVSENVL